MAEVFRMPKSFGAVRDFETYLRSIDTNPWSGAPIALPQLPTTSLCDPKRIGEFRVGNALCCAAMEGWDGTEDGSTFAPGLPTHLTLRRWQNFGRSGGKLIFGGEAVAVVPEGRANPWQLCWSDYFGDALCVLHDALFSAHAQAFGKDALSSLATGLQLTHSGRWCCLKRGLKQPRTMHRHPVLDKRVGADATSLMSDSELDALPAYYARLAKLAYRAGFLFVDVKACHGYLLHESLGAKTRPGKYGGSFENRTRLYRAIVEAIRAEAPQIMICTRISVWDAPPMEDEVSYDPSQYHFGVGPKGDIDLHEPMKFLVLAKQLGIAAVHISACSPYYSSQVQRPAFRLAKDALQLKFNPLEGVLQQIRTVEVLRRGVPDLPLVASGMTALGRYFGQVASWMLEAGLADFVSAGRMLFAYPRFFSDLCAGNLEEDRLCATCSQCTNVVRAGFPASGCLVRDGVYKRLPAHSSFC